MYKEERECDKRKKCVEKKDHPTPKPENTSCDEKPKSAKKSPNLITLPAALRRIGPRQIEQCKPFIMSSLMYGAACFVALLYITDWRVFVDHIPFYNGKFPPVEEPTKKEQKDDE